MSDRIQGDFEDWFKRVYGKFQNYGHPVIRAVAEAAWRAATLVEQERCAGIAGDIGGGLATCGYEVTSITLSSVAFSVAKRIRGKEST